MLVHVMAQAEAKPGDGPIALICAPTRELCQQIHSECKKFGKCYNIRVSFTLSVCVCVCVCVTNFLFLTQENRFAND